MTPANESGIASPAQHPDLSNEVATLSNKLINAINHQTNLDDTLSATRHELESARERIKQLEQENQEQAATLIREASIQKSTAEAEKSKFLASLAEERRQRAEVEKEKKNIELELENLTTALFEEANKVDTQTKTSSGRWLTSADGDHSPGSRAEGSRCCATKERPTQSTAS
jgi:chromosome segregation ATPase